MTFTEAAIEVLRREGKPLHFRKISEIAIRESLLDHVGKIPEETMAGQLAAHCRLPRPERRVLPVQPGTFALVEWGLEEDPAGLDDLVEPPPEGEPTYRDQERHPILSSSAGRAARPEGGRGRRREEERRAKRYPPPAEVAYEILAGAGRALALSDVAAQGAERLLMPDAFVRDAGALSAALREDNRRRESAGRKPLFALDGDQVTLVAQPEPEERAAALAVPAGPRAAATPADLRRAGLAALRRRLRECDGPTLEHVANRLLEKLGFKELKVAKRGREQVLYTARRRMGLGDVRHCVRILRGGADAGRRDVTDLRRDLGHYGAQIGILLSAGEAARDARGDAAAAGQLPVLLLCGEALAEAFAEAGVGATVVAIPEVDDAFFRQAAEAAVDEEAARRARREERERDRERRGGRRPEPDRAEGQEPPEPSEAAGAEAAEAAEPERAPSAPRSIVVDAIAPSLDAEEGEGEGDDGPEDDGPEGDEDDEREGAQAAAAGGAPGTAGGAEGARAEGRRRRRRRRRRGGRGRSREGGGPAAAGAATPGAGGTAPGGAEAAPATGGEGGGPAPAQASEPPREPAPTRPEGDGEGSPPAA